jgi:hypothetical protein
MMIQFRVTRERQFATFRCVFVDQVVENTATENCVVARGRQRQDISDRKRDVWRRCTQRPIRLLDEMRGHVDATVDSPRWSPSG